MKKQSIDIKLLDISQVAEILHVSVKTIERRIESGSFIRIVKEGRKRLFRISDIEKYIDQNTY